MNQLLSHISKSNCFRVAALCFLSLLLPFELASSDLGDGANSRFQKASKELSKIEAAEGASAAAAEIAVARRWLEDGKTLLESGEMESAAQIAERLPSQLDLIRIVIAAGLALAQAQQVEREVFALERKLKVLKARRDRLLLQKEGARVSGAFPSIKEEVK